MYFRHNLVHVLTIDLYTLSIFCVYVYNLNSQMVRDCYSYQQDVLYAHKKNMECAGSVT